VLDALGRLHPPSPPPVAVACRRVSRPEAEQANVSRRRDMLAMFGFKEFEVLLVFAHHHLVRPPNARQMLRIQVGPFLNFCESMFQVRQFLFGLPITFECQGFPQESPPIPTSNCAVIPGILRGYEPGRQEAHRKAVVSGMQTAYSRR
jgi:hypothetical protein